MTEHEDPEANESPETFIVGEWADFVESEYHSKVQITEVSGTEVTALVDGQPMVFVPRESDGKFVKLGSPDYEILPTMIFHTEPKHEKKTSRWQAVWDFIRGMLSSP